MEQPHENRCPRCWGLIPNNLEPGKYRGAMTRSDDEGTEVCSFCDMEEAIAEEAGHDLFEERMCWPIPSVRSLGYLTFAPMVDSVPDS